MRCLLKCKATYINTETSIIIYENESDRQEITCVGIILMSDTDKTNVDTTYVTSANIIPWHIMYEKRQMAEYEGSGSFN